jgi:hypothetical protein
MFSLFIIYSYLVLPGQLVEQLGQLVDEHHRLDQLHVAELRVPVDVRGADHQRRADHAFGVRLGTGVWEILNC